MNEIVLVRAFGARVPGAGHRFLLGVSPPQVRGRVRCSPRLLARRTAHLPARSSFSRTVPDVEDAVRSEGVRELLGILDVRSSRMALYALPPGTESVALESLTASAGGHVCSVDFVRDVSGVVPHMPGASAPLGRPSPFRTAACGSLLSASMTPGSGAPTFTGTRARPCAARVSRPVVASWSGIVRAPAPTTSSARWRMPQSPGFAWTGSQGGAAVMERRHA